MTLTTPYSATFIVGDGETKTFSYLFEEVSPNFISVMVYNSVTGLISTPTYIIDTDQKQVIFGEDTPAPTADETVCIYRNTPNVQDVAFRTLHGYDAQTLENILSKIVAMIQEIKSNYFSTQVLQGDPWQLDLLSSADDGATVNIDYTAKKLVKGLYFKITSGNLQVSADGMTYLTLPKSDDVAEFRQYEQTLPDLTVIRKLQYRVGNQWFDAEANAQYTADEAYALAESVQTTMSAHINNTQNPHQTSMANLADTDLAGAESGQFLQFNGVKWKAVYSTASVSWGGILGDIADQTDLQDKLHTKFDKTGGTVSGEIDIRRNSSTSSALLSMTNNTANTARIWHFAPSYSTVSLSVYPGSTETNGYRFVSTGFCPASNNARYLGAASLKWKGVYTGVINNGYDIAVPVTNSADTFALESEITDINGKIPAQASTSNQLADKNFVNSSIATNTANFIGTFNSVADLEAYSGTVTNNDYAFVIGTDSAGNTTYNRYKYNGTTQQWVYEYTLNNSSFTAEQWASINSGVTSSDVTLARSALQPGDLPTIGDGTITINQGGTAKGTFTVNQSGNTTIDLDAGGTTTGQSIDAEIVGTLTITDNSVVSGFGTTNYLALPGAFTLNDTNSFEIKITFTTKSSVYSTQWIAISSKYNSGAGSCFMLSGGKVFVVLGSDIASQTVSGVTTLSASTKYYVKLLYDGDRYTLSLSTDDVNYTQEAYVVATALPAPDTICFGQGIQGTDVPSAIHMDSCYIKKNGVIIWQGMDAPGLHQRAAKGHEVIAFQAPTAANNYTWYRKYADGWVEQGGFNHSINLSSSGSSNMINLPVTMADTNYTAQATLCNQYGGRQVGIVTTTSTTTQVNVGGYASSSSSSAVNWQVSGMAA